MNKTHQTCFFLDINFDRTDEVLITNIVTCIINSVFSLLTFWGNFIILHAIRKAPDLHSPSFLLLCCLAVPDLLVGAICQPVLVALNITDILDDLNAFCILTMIQFMTGYITSAVSALTLTAVSIDRLLALTLHLRYNAIVTVPRVFQTAFFFWIFCITVVALKIWMSNAEWNFIPVAISFLTLCVVTFSTSKIFLIARRHKRQIKSQTRAALSLQTNTVNVLKCKKSAATVLYIYGLFLIFYIPFIVTIILETLVGYTRTMKIVFSYTTTAVFINSFLNPIVYCWRIREIRRAVKNVFRRKR